MKTPRSYCSASMRSHGSSPETSSLAPFWTGSPECRSSTPEFEVGWIPFFNWWLDRFQNDWGHRMKMPDLKIKASDYMRKTDLAWVYR